MTASSSSALALAGRAGAALEPETALIEEEGRQYQRILSVAASQEQRLTRHAALRKSPGYDISDPWLDAGGNKAGGTSQQRLLPGAPCRVVGSGGVAAHLGPGPDGGCRVRMADGAEVVRARDRLLPLPTQAAEPGSWAFPVDLPPEQCRYHGRRGFCGLAGVIPGPPARQGLWVSFEPSDPTQPPEMVLIDRERLVALPEAPAGALATPWEARHSAGALALADAGAPLALPDEAALEKQLAIRYGEEDDEEEASSERSVDLDVEGGGEDEDEDEDEEEEEENDEEGDEEGEGGASASGGGASSSGAAAPSKAIAEGSLVQFGPKGQQRHARVERLGGSGKDGVEAGSALLLVLEDGSRQQVPLAKLDAASEQALELAARCGICGRAEPAERLLLCENFARSCLGAAHLDCLTPPLREVPEGAWFCGRCQGPGGAGGPACPPADAARAAVGTSAGGKRPRPPAAGASGAAAASKAAKAGARPAKAKAAAKRPPAKRAR